jgi:hypothetical protein
LERRDIAREHLVKKYDYPDIDIARVVYDPHFAIGGLHYDVEKGLLLKVDSSQKIQLGTMYRCKEMLEDHKLLGMYKRRQLDVCNLSW